jgi:hypothetical protein
MEKRFIFRGNAVGAAGDTENAYKTLANSVVKGLNVNGRLTLLRLALGSPLVGEITCSEVEINGSVIY